MSTSIGTALTDAARTLQANGINEPRLDAGLLIGHVIGRDRAFVVAHPEAAITEQQLKQFEEFVARRAAGEPLQYITGHQEFFKLDFEVTADVEMNRLQREVRREPRSALIAGPDGLSVIRRLLVDAPSYIRRGGYLIFEFGINQEQAIRDLVNREVWKLIEIRNDLKQIPRI